MQGINKMNSYLAGFLSVVLVGSMYCDNGPKRKTGSVNRSSSENYAVEVRSRNVDIIEATQAPNLMIAAKTAYSNNDLITAVDLFEKAMIKSYMGGRPDIFDGVAYDNYMNALNRIDISKFDRQSRQNMIIATRESRTLQELSNHLRDDERYEFDRQLSDVISLGIYATATDRSVTNGVKKDWFRQIERGVGQNLMLHVLKMIPLKDPNTNQITNIELLLKDLMGDNFSGTPMGSDPLGVLADLLFFKNYSIDRFVDENLLSQNTTYQTIQNNQQSFSEPEYYINGRRIDSKYLDRDSYGNALPSIREDRYRQMLAQEQRSREDAENAREMQIRAQESWRQREQQVRQWSDDVSRDAGRNFNNISQSAQQGIRDAQRNTQRQLNNTNKALQNMGKGINKGIQEWMNKKKKRG